MDTNVVHLLRPAHARPAPERLAMYVRVGRNDHSEILDLIATGERGIFGFVIEAQYVERHHELITEVRNQGFDLILDPKTQPMGFPGGHTAPLAALPWGLERHHNLSDFEGPQGRSKAAQIAEMATRYGFTQVLGPTHLLSGYDDPWLLRDIAMMEWTRETLTNYGSDLGLIYSLALPMEVLRKRMERRALIAAIADAPCDAIWLKVENFGDDASGEKTAAYIEACGDFHERNIPVVGDHVGGLPGLSALAFGAVGGIAHGVTMQQVFRPASWRRPRRPTAGGPIRRVYIPQLDMLMKPDVARGLFATSARIRARYGCRNTHCCPHGIQDMLNRPARHALYQRAREIERLSTTPQTIRVAGYLDEYVRPVSDNVAAVASATGLDEALLRGLRRKQTSMSRFRQAMVHLGQAAPLSTVAISPSQRASRGRHGA